jgi:cytochrome oxidase assembly protein ShyY1
LGKRSGSKGKEKGEKHDPAQQLSPSIERRFVIQRGWVSESEENDQNKEKHPSGVVKEGDEGHDSERDEIEGATSPPEKGIKDMPPI